MKSNDARYLFGARNHKTYEEKMNKKIEELSEVKLVGITARTSNSLEINSDTAKIGNFNAI